ncbi:MAG: hybrid sensor histidine kinase/response regulator [Verrucomicrobia bacterium]|nr:hybrid sensor histidine kinase/response regulator [Verrucomicrobiota bacterium]
MKTILVLTEHPDFAESVRAAVGPAEHRVIHRADLQSAEPLLNPQLLDACILDADLSSVQQLWLVEKLRRRLPNCPLLLCTGSVKAEWEEEAYLQGVHQVMVKPVRARLLNVFLDRAWRSGAVPAAAPLAPVPPAGSEAGDTALLRAPPFQALETLSALRDFSAILGDSLCAEALLRQFLLRLREVLGVNRSVVFLRPPRHGLGNQAAAEEFRLLRSVCAVGIPASLLEHFELSVDAGIGGYVHRHGRILRRDHPEAARDPAIMREFDLLGVQVAIPMFDRETLVGLTLLDGRVTGEALSNAELRLLFHLLEAIGLAVKNIWLHDQLVVNHDMLADVLRQFSSGCLVVGQDLGILHANKAARACFSNAGRMNQNFEFSDLPEALAGKVYQVLRSGTGTPPFRYEQVGAQRNVYQISIVPVQGRNAVLPTSALMVIEDQTQSEHLRHLEIEAANLRLVRQMADRLAHEVGNAMVPLSTHQQLFTKKYSDAEFRGSLDNALTEGVRRVSRLINQMRLLARDAVDFKEIFPLGPLLEEAYQEAQKYQPNKAAQLKHNLGEQALFLAGDRVALKHAFVEILLNALQANPATPRIGVNAQTQPGDNGTDWALIEFRDNGTGFTPEAAARAFEPFYTTRNVGLGLGLVVSRKVAESHRGRLEIASPGTAEGAGVVRFSLPLTQPIPGEDGAGTGFLRRTELKRKER